jgi:hypothetical protein
MRPSFRKLAFAALLVASIAAASPVFAQVPTSCFNRDECIGTDTDAITGDCNREHCFATDDPSCPAGTGSCYAKSQPVPLTVAIGTRSYAIDLSDYVALVYNFGAGIAAVVAAVVAMVGGLQYLTAGADASRVTAAKKRISGALIGLALALGAYAILNTINPDILLLRLPKVKIVKRAEFIDCRFSEKCQPCGVKYGIVRTPGDANFKKSLATLGDTCDPKLITTNLKTSNIVALCVGKGCAKAGCSDDVTFACSPGSAKPVASCFRAPSASGGEVDTAFSCKSCKAGGNDCTVGAAGDLDCCSGKCTPNSSGSKAGHCGGFIQNGKVCGSDGDCISGRCTTISSVFNTDVWAHNCSKNGGELIINPFRGFPGCSVVGPTGAVIGRAFGLCAAPTF